MRAVDGKQRIYLEWPKNKDLAQQVLLQVSIINVTEFDKTRLPHTSNFLTLTSCNLTTQQAIGLKFSQSPTIA